MEEQCRPTCGVEAMCLHMLIILNSGEALKKILEEQKRRKIIESSSLLLYKVFCSLFYCLHLVTCKVYIKKILIMYSLSHNI